MLGRNELIHLISNNEWEKARELIEENGSLVRKWTVAPSLTGGVHAADILPIHQACKMEDISVHFLESILFAYPESIRKRETGFRRIALHIAIRARCSDDVILYLLNKFPDAASVQDVLGRVPLHYAISNFSSMQVIQQLISACPEAARAADNLGWTPLHVAANTARSVEMVETLVHSSSESVVSKTRKGNTPLMCANMAKGPDKDIIVSVLIEEEQKFEKTAYFQNFRDAEQRANIDPALDLHQAGRFLGMRKIRRSNSFRLVV
jgi:hypothetical protein